MANLMDLVRELKVLNKRKKAGDALSEAEEARRKELKVYLKDVLQKSKGTSGSSTSEGKPVRSQVSQAPPSNPPTPVATPAPAQVAPEPPKRAYQPKKNAFAIDAGNLFDAALGSEAVQQAAPAAEPVAAAPNTAAPRRARKLADLGLEDHQYKRIDANVVNSVERAADAAIEAQRALPRVADFDDVANQLHTVGSTYTPPAATIAAEQYFDPYFGEGFVEAKGSELKGLKPIDPREQEIHALGDLSKVVIPRGLAFLDDFPALYRSGILPSPDDEVEADSDDPDLLIPGKRKVTVHFINGQVKRGVVRRFGKGDLGFTLEGQTGATEIALQQIKAIFVHLKGAPKQGPGKQLTVIFRDRRKVRGSSDDYRPGQPMFSLVPPATNQKYERIIVNTGAVQNVT